MREITSIDELEDNKNYLVYFNLKEEPDIHFHGKINRSVDGFVRNKAFQVFTLPTLEEVEKLCQKS